MRKLLTDIEARLSARLKAATVTIVEGLLDFYFTGIARNVDWFPAGGKPRLEAAVQATRRIKRNHYQVCIETTSGERRWIDVRRGRRDNKTGRWAFYEE